MANQGWEIEVKFLIKDLQALEQRLLAVGAELVQPRLFESNLRFDSPDGKLSRQHHVLRLRRDAHASLTYKLPPDDNSSVSIRREIEFQVSSFEEAQAFLEALGYAVKIRYEKYRAVYTTNEVSICLDELPYGAFVEIEGPDPASIEIMAAVLHLNWAARTTDSYLQLFERVKQAKSIEADHLSFEALLGYDFRAADFGLAYADVPAA